MLSKLKFFVPALLFLLVFSSCEEEDTSPSDTNDGGGTPGNVALNASSSASDSEGNTYEVGFDQVSGNNQNPFVIKKSSSGEQLWKVSHESTGVDCRAAMVSVAENGSPWVVFTLDGGSNDGTYITKKEVSSGAFDGVFMNSYGSGGGPKVAVLAKLNPDNGKIEKGTFLTARLTSGKTNSLSVEKIGFTDGKFALEASSAAWPPGKGSSYVRMPDITDEDRTDNKFLLYYEFSADLSQITEARLR